VTVDIEDFVHMGDLNHYSTATDTATSSISAFDFAIKQYWAGMSSRPRIEILAKKATVVRKLFDASEKVRAL
jgi:hypothetical protein